MIPVNLKSLPWDQSIPVGFTVLDSPSPAPKKKSSEFVVIYVFRKNGARDFA